MPVITTCPGCHRKIRIADDLLGSRVRCPSCRTTFQSSLDEPEPLPEEEEAPAAEEEPAAPRPRRAAKEEGVRERRPPRCPPPAASADDDEDEDDRPRRPRRQRRRPFHGVAAGDWRKVLTGLNLYVASIFVVLGAFVVLGIGVVTVGGALASSARGPGGQVEPGQVLASAGGLLAVLCAFGLLALLSYVLRFVGLIFCLGAPDEHGAKVLAIVVLVLAGLSLLSSCGGGLVGSGGMHVQNSSGAAHATTSGGPPVGNIFTTASGGLSLVQTVVFLFFLRALALGLREDGLARGVIALLIGWGAGAFVSGLSCCVGISLAAGTLASAASDSHDVQEVLPRLGAAGVIFLILLGLVWAGLLLWYLVVLFMVRGAVAGHVQSAG